MAFKEIFELGSLLHGDDQEKAELDRQITSITSNIKQQEGRVSKANI